MTSGVAAAPAADPPRQGPRLLAKGPTFALHVFRGLAVPDARFRRFTSDHYIVPGFVVSHTNLESGETTWLSQSGILQHETRRLSYSASRLVGLAHDGDHLLTVHCFQERIFTEGDRPPEAPDPAKARYFVGLWSMSEGKVLDGHELEDRDMLPKALPNETDSDGVIKVTEGAYEILGRRMSVERGKLVVTRGSS